MRGRIEKRLREALGEETELVLEDPRNDGVHLEAKVISPLFGSLSSLQRHRLVMEALKELFDEDLHALALRTYSPQEWKNI